MASERNLRCSVSHCWALLDDLCQMLTASHQKVEFVVCLAH